jgi:GTP cyclohydrolase I
MTGNEGKARLDGPVAVSGMDVCVAEPRGLDANNHLTVTRCRDGTFLDDEWLTEIMNNCCFHQILQAIRVGRVLMNVAS